MPHIGQPASPNWLGKRACPEPCSAVSASLKRAVFTEVFGTLTGVSMPPLPQPVAADATELDLGRHAGRYERTSRRFDVSARDGRLQLRLTATGELAVITDAEPEELILYPADASGVNFVCRSHDVEPWSPVSFGRLPDRAPYLFAGGRITPRVR